MVPRSKSNSQTGQRQVSNFIEVDDFAEIQLRPSPTSIADNKEIKSSDNDARESQTDEETTEDESPVTEDNFQVKMNALLFLVSHI